MYAPRISKATIVAAGLSLLLMPLVAQAILPPDSAYCRALGYTFVVEQGPAGEMGKCELPNGQRVNSAEFLAGKVATEWSYCAQNGYEAKHVEDAAVCKNCLLCVMPDGSEVRATRLMDLNLLETSCGDGYCGIPENFQTCPVDCPSGSTDGLCDGVLDGIVDVDCEEGEDPDSAPAMKCDLDGDYDIDRDDVMVIFELRGTYSPPSDPLADVNDDGIISINDARGCVLRCTRPRCAVQ